MKNIGYSFNGFTSARLKRFLITGGQSFTFVEVDKNEYNEPTQEVTKQITILGVLRKYSASSQSLSSENSSAGSKIRSRSQTSIMTSWESLADGFSGGKELSPDMTISIDGVSYKITESKDLNNWGIVAEIYLEEYDEWKH